MKPLTVTLGKSILFRSLDHFKSITKAVRLVVASKRVWLPNFSLLLSADRSFVINATYSNKNCLASHIPPLAQGWNNHWSSKGQCNRRILKHVTDDNMALSASNSMASPVVYKWLCCLRSCLSHTMHVQYLWGCAHDRWECFRSTSLQRIVTSEQCCAFVVS